MPTKGALDAGNCPPPLRHLPQIRPLKFGRDEGVSVVFGGGKAVLRVFVAFKQSPRSATVTGQRKRLGDRLIVEAHNKSFILQEEK